MRVTAHDRGLMWDGAWQALDGSDGKAGELILEFIADLHVHRWTIAIKVGGSNGMNLMNKSPAASDPPAGSHQWRRGRFFARTGSVWSADLTDASPTEAVAEAKAAEIWMQCVAEEAQRAAIS